jgi:hypothetical protein
MDPVIALKRPQEVWMGLKEVQANDKPLDLGSIRL